MSINGQNTVFAVAAAFLAGTDTDTIAEILAYGEDFAQSDAIDEARALKIQAPGSYESTRGDGSYVGWGPNWG